MRFLFVPGVLVLLATVLFGGLAFHAATTATNERALWTRRANRALLRPEFATKECVISHNLAIVYRKELDTHFYFVEPYVYSVTSNQARIEMSYFTLHGRHITNVSLVGQDAACVLELVNSRRRV